MCAEKQCRLFIAAIFSVFFLLSDTSSIKSTEVKENETNITEKTEDPREKELVEAVIKNDFSEVRRLIDDGVSANVVFKDQKSMSQSGGGVLIIHTPILFYAIRNGDESMVRYLVEHGADVNAESYRSDPGGIDFWIITTRTRTPLCEALRENRLKIAIYLIENGADVKTPNTESRKGDRWRPSYNETRSSMQIIQDRIKELQEVADLIQQKLDETKTNENKEAETNEN